MATSAITSLDSNLDSLISTEECAELLGLKPSTLRFYRRTGITANAPKFVRLNSHVVRYRLSDVQSFIAEQKCCEASSR